MSEEFNLSEKIEKVEFTPKGWGNCEMILKEDVKEFIKLIKRSNIKNWSDGLQVMEQEIDKLAGDKLT